MPKEFVSHENDTSLNYKGGTLDESGQSGGITHQTKMLPLPLVPRPPGFKRKAGGEE